LIKSSFYQFTHNGEAMIEEKKKYDFPKPEIKTVRLGDQKVSVEPFLDDNSQRVILGSYIKELFKGGEYGILDAENGLVIITYVKIKFQRKNIFTIRKRMFRFVFYIPSRKKF